MIQERIRWIDITKGLLIIMVVFGHIFQSLPTPTYTTAFHVIYSFHMPAFFIISGFTLNTATSFKTFFCKKIKHLMMPYLFFCLYITSLAVIKTLAGFYPAFPNIFTLDTFLINPHSYFSILWFLPCLFISELIYHFLSKIDSELMQFIVCITCALSSLTYIRLGFYPLPFMINSALFSLPFLYCGQRLKQSYNMSKIHFVVCLLLFVIVNMIAEKSHYTAYLFFSLDISSLPIFVCTSVCGAILIIFISNQLHTCTTLEFLGHNSLYIYGLHFSILAVLQKIYLSNSLREIPCFIYFIILIFIAFLTISLCLMIRLFLKIISISISKCIRSAPRFFGK